jgi:hypothetical protein
MDVKVTNLDRLLMAPPIAQGMVGIVNAGEREGSAEK